MQRKYNERELFEYALKSLGARAQSSGEIRAKLARKAEREEDIPRVLSRLKEYGYLDDTKFAESYASARRDSGGFGKARVLRDLRQRRVAGAVAGKAVQDAYGDVDETALIEQWLERKMRNVDLRELLQDEKRLASTYRKLRYAGFSSGASIAVLKRFASRAEELQDEDPDTP